MATGSTAQAHRQKSSGPPRQLRKHHRSHHSPVLHGLSPCLAGTPTTMEWAQKKEHENIYHYSRLICYCYKPRKKYKSSNFIRKQTLKTGVPVVTHKAKLTILFAILAYVDCWWLFTQPIHEACFCVLIHLGASWRGRSAHHTIDMCGLMKTVDTLPWHNTHDRWSVGVYI